MNGPPRIVLGLETSTRRGSAALLVEGAPPVERFLDPLAFQGRDLAPAAAELLAGAGVEPRAVELVAVGLGPGSFTGLRVGVSFARAFAYGAGIPVVGVPSFDALAAERPGRAGEWILCVAPAGRDAFYYAVYRAGDEGPPIPEEGPGLLPRGDAARRAAGASAVLGEGAEHLLPGGPAGEPVPGRLPGAAGVARIGRARYVEDGPTPPEQLLPLYLQRSRAEINWERGMTGRGTDSNPRGGGNLRKRD